MNETELRSFSHFEILTKIAYPVSRVLHGLVPLINMQKLHF